MRRPHKITQKIGLKQATNSTKRVFNYLQGYFNVNKQCYASNQYLADKLELSVSTVKRALRELEHMGLIKATYSRIGRKTTRHISKPKMLEFINQVEENTSEETLATAKKLGFI